jgi:hypothetical protein
MTQEAITEIDMDVFSRRIGPYFTWLESRIESGWQQNDSVQKDILKEVKYLATTMRARFILGVSKEDFTKEVQRAIELFELATEAFPSESDEVEAKMSHFCKGISEELGAEFLPKEYQPNIPRPPQPPQPHPFPMPEPEPGPEPDEPQEPDEEKIKIEAPKVEKIKQKTVKAEPKAEAKPEAPKVKKEPKTKKTEAAEEKPAKIEKTKKTKSEKPKKTKRKSFFLVRWVKNFVYGED